jgi:alkanesulfonate monooxygenase SsuD/methylene tetrahydromethanopterin reductase-like flavin-dependent oxidoreductase (luciferase family)/ketosteroid isomerase-like protein
VDVCPNLVDDGVDPVSWARQREAEGWPVLSASDHLWDPGRAYPHWAVTLTQLAMATEGPRIASSFANNLLRSPVEFAQAALALQRASSGRFEAGLGAGWSRGEVEGIGARFPGAPERAGRYREAMTIVRALFDDGACSFRGDHHVVEVPTIGPAVAPPPLVGSVGGPRTIREITPLVDRVELKVSSTATRGGTLELGALAAIDLDDLDRLIGLVRDVDADIPIGVFLMAGCGDHPRVRALGAALGDGLMGSLVGEPAAVAERILALADRGLDRVQLTPYTPDTIELLAPHLAGHGGPDHAAVEDDAHATVQRFWQIQDDGDYERLTALFAEDAVLEDPVFGTFRGAGAIAGFMARMNVEMRARGASFHLLELAGDGGTAWARWQATTAAGSRTGVGVYRVEGGRLTYYRDVMDPVT